ncbi:protein kinase domain-containing protein [Streptomyces sp. NBC_01451]|uniref:protein kinase domain-containing protein n=1 Tax=Streptomyces sp. NBC_01451 TaxID=2903872 RepID=UPI002E36D6D0|nr:hypothetical protein [Streptomyces sp. NBC_01451]
MIRTRSASGREWLLGDVVGSGSEGVVYTVDGQPGLVAKLVPLPAEADNYRLRVESLVRQGREPRTVRLLSGTPSRLAWPLETLGTSGGVTGYLMRDMRRAFLPFEHVLLPTARRESLPSATWATALRTAASLAELVADLHAEGYVIGDLKPDNLWSDAEGRTGLADIDSLQFTDGRRTFPCRMRSPGYTAPEGIDSDALPDRASDCFVLAVLVHQLLMGGLHPFHGRPADGSPYFSLDDNVRNGRCRITDRGSVVLPRAAPPVDLLPRGLTALFVQVFGRSGRGDPATRPDAAAWARGLRAESRPGRLTACDRDDSHVHTVERPWCPWCDQQERGGTTWAATDTRPGNSEVRRP